MLVTLFIWLSVMLISGLAGSLILSLILVEGDELASDEAFIICQWLGLFCLPELFLVTTFFGALKPLVTIALVFCIALIALGYSPSRQIFLKAFVSAFGAFQKLSLVILTVLCGLYASQVIYWGDTGAYHFSLVRWLSEYGSVPGLALLDARFGFTSSWFAFIAVWNHGFLAGHIGAVLGGYVLWLMLFHWGVAIVGSIRDNNSQAAYFVVLGYGILFPLMLRWGIFISSSPDVIIMVLGVLTGSIILNAKLNPRTGIWIVLALAAFAFNIKFTAIPLLVGAFFLSLFYLRGRQMICAGLFILCATLPVLIGNTISSGYPLYPSTLLSFDLPWRLDVDTANNNRKVVFDLWPCNF